MKARMVFSVLLLALGASNVIAEAVPDINIQGVREHQNQFLTKDQRGIQSCATFFVADILPGDQTNVKVIDAEPRSQVLMSPIVFMQRPVMQVAMEATDANDGKLLAKASCRVDSRAAVVGITTTKLDEQRLASITIKELRFVASVK